MNFKLAILHPQLATFQYPFDLVYKYELNQSPQNTKLVRELYSGKSHVDELVARIRRAYPKSLTLPMGRKLNESELDDQAKTLLTTVQHLTHVAPTPANVKIYRNFVIVNVFIEAIRMIDPCIP
ncbi:uncharacterized protein LOC116302040 [Actinia tenebrosa]|uniref:Uncharacterized protein LOC116302040 n=1 Tax=Actinia tenebrosa TaxID=6105 RepID=A0A6P8IJX5_ACTTE|nr:uncharacterized protein LOC116302040 [Actinia tenebrosa]XP_031567094.1 uncharacterized protein LOC116302040 [Actinia tenebrosa]